VRACVCSHARAQSVVRGRRWKGLGRNMIGPCLHFLLAKLEPFFPSVFFWFLVVLSTCLANCAIPNCCKVSWFALMLETERKRARARHREKNKSSVLAWVSRWACTFARDFRCEHYLPHIRMPQKLPLNSLQLIGRKTTRTVLLFFLVYSDSRATASRRR